MRHTLEFRWSISRERDTYGYNICSLWVDGRKVTSCNGGGYDMRGTVLGNYIAATFADRLRTLDKPFYGLTFHDLTYRPGQEVIDGETIEQREAEGKSLGLERYQAVFAASSKVPTAKHTAPHINGATGLNSVETIIRAIGCSLEYIPTKGEKSVYILTCPDATPAAVSP